MKKIKLLILFTAITANGFTQKKEKSLALDEYLTIVSNYDDTIANLKFVINELLSERKIMKDTIDDYKILRYTIANIDLLIEPIIKDSIYTQVINKYIQDVIWKPNHTQLRTLSWPNTINKLMYDMLENGDFNEKESEELLANIIVKSTQSMKASNQSIPKINPITPISNQDISLQTRKIKDEITQLNKKHPTLNLERNINNQVQISLQKYEKSVPKPNQIKMDEMELELYKKLLKKTKEAYKL